MKNVLLLSAFIIGMFCFQSCDSTAGGSKQIVTFENYRMAKDTTLVFEFDNADENQLYDIVLMFRYASGFQLPQVVFDVEYKADGVEPFSSVLGIQVVDKNKQYIGDGSGDIWDIEKTLFENRKLVKGKSTLTIKNTLPYDYIPNVMEVGVKFVKK